MAGVTETGIGSDVEVVGNMADNIPRKVADRHAQYFMVTGEIDFCQP